MNLTNIEWTDRTWNPVTGCLGPGGRAEKPNHCLYCYAKRMAEGRLRGRYGYDAEYPFKPTFHPDRLREPLKVKQPLKIFVVSMGDLFGDWVPDEWIEAVLDVVNQCPQHTFQFLTKNPRRYRTGKKPYRWPTNCWVGATITGELERQRRHNWMNFVDAPVRFFSIEPLLERIWITRVSRYGARWPDWLIIGEQAGPGSKPPIEHVVRWAMALIEDCEARGIPVYVKRPLSNRIPNAPKEFPE